jgi:hypothetical protein
MSEDKMIEELAKNISDLQSSLITGFKVEDLYMSDRQCVKKILSERVPDISDDDLNLVVFGRDIRSELGPAYIPYVSENQFIVENEEGKTRNGIIREEVRIDDPDSPYKPISSTDQVFEEVDELKSDIKTDVFLIQEKLKDLTKEAGTTATLIINSIPGVAVMVAPPTFNIPGGISLLMLGLSSLGGLLTKVKEITPLLSKLQKSNYVIDVRSLSKLTTFLNTALTGLNAIGKTIGSLQLISESKLNSLQESKLKIEGVDNELNNLRREQFRTTTEFENRKKILTNQKELYSKEAENNIKS